MSQIVSFRLRIIFQDYMWRSALFGTAYTILKKQKKPMEECYFS